jgi:hypothetical protein
MKGGEHMANVLDLQGMSIAGYVDYCPSNKSVIIIVTTFRA